ncbi:unnamed protein product [Lepidochelys kempii]
MESGSIFLLLGLLAVWAELQAVAGQGDKHDICRLPPEQGPCKGRIPRYFYNPASRTCESFIYGGCKGNKNNFKTKAECVRACRPPGAWDRARPLPRWGGGRCCPDPYHKLGGQNYTGAGLQQFKEPWYLSRWEVWSNKRSPEFQPCCGWGGTWGVLNHRARSHGPVSQEVLSSSIASYCVALGSHCHPVSRFDLPPEEANGHMGQPGTQGPGQEPGQGRLRCRHLTPVLAQVGCSTGVVLEASLPPGNPDSRD